MSLDPISAMRCPRRTTWSSFTSRPDPDRQAALRTYLYSLAYLAALAVYQGARAAGMG